MWLRQPEALLAKSINHPIQIAFSINSLCTLSKYNILKSSNSPDVDLEVLRTVSNIPVLTSSHYERMSAYKVSSTFSNSGVKTEFVGFEIDPGYFCGKDMDLPGMWRRRPFTQPDFPINEMKNKESN
jgi:hypothetical protein